MKREQPLLTTVLLKIAPQIGAKIVMEPKWRMAGQIAFKNGKKRFFRYSSLDVNLSGAFEIAKDKDFANFFMGKMGYPTIDGDTFFSDAWAKSIGSDKTTDKAFAYAKELGFPVIVKPNSGSQGIGVALVHDKEEFYRAMEFVFTKDKIALVERYIPGKDHRIVVFEGAVVAAYERIPLSVVGDGISSVEALISKKKQALAKDKRHVFLDSKDPRIEAKLKRNGLSFASVPAKGRQVFLLDNANLSAGGDSIDVTDIIHPGWKEIAANITKDMGLSFCGVDIMAQTDISKAPRGKKSYRVIEINGSPGLDHYAKSGAKQKKAVEDLYLRILKRMER